MPEEETLKDALVDIRTKLLARDFYKNEEHVRFSLVGRVLKALGWDIWNPKEVHTEFIAVPTEDKGKVDIALFIGNKHNVFIEVKPVDYWENALIKLDDAENQLEKYLRKFSAPFGVITDGRRWRFYFTYSPGELRDRFFKDFDLTNQIDESELYCILSKEALEEGSAENTARDYLKRTERSRAIRRLVPEAIKLADEDPTISKVQALKELAKKEHNYEISDDEAKTAIKEGSLPKPEYITPPPPRVKPPKGDNVKPKYMILADERYEIKHYNQILFNTVEWLIKRGKLNEPIILNEKRYLINYQPKHQYRDYITPRQLSNSLYIELHFRTKRFLSLSKFLLRKCGFSEDLLEIGYE